MVILGIETSCDENAAAVVRDGREVLSSVVASQIDLHRVYGGVVPEIAARSHIELMMPVVDEALNKAFPAKRPQSHHSNPRSLTSRSQTSEERGAIGQAAVRKLDPWKAIDAIAVTKGPGLLGSLLIGTLTARTLAYLKNKPIYGVDHVLGHAHANLLLKPQPKFPMLSLIVSGGHTQLVLFKDYFDYRLLGQTKDDAAGEAFDKVAKILGLPYPGGPSIEKAAANGQADAFDLPKAKLDNPYDFSFSGLKTAALRQVQHLAGKDYRFPSHKLPGLLDEPTRNNVAASFQQAAIGALVDAVEQAYKEFKPASVTIGGGVAASKALREQLSERLPINMRYIDMSLCTDNAAMIATLGYYVSQTRQPDDVLSMEVEPNLKMEARSSSLESRI